MEVSQYWLLYTTFCNIITVYLEIKLLSTPTKSTPYQKGQNSLIIFSSSYLLSALMASKSSPSNPPLHFTKLQLYPHYPPSADPHYLLHSGMRIWIAAILIFSFFLRLVDLLPSLFIFEASLSTIITIQYTDALNQVLKVKYKQLQSKKMFCTKVYPRDTMKERVIQHGIYKGEWSP